MTSTQKKLFLALCSGGLATLCIASFAWACSAQATKVTFFPGAGPGRTDLRVEAAGFRPGQVEVRWNSSEGPLMGNGTADAKGNVLTSAVVPDSGPSINYVVVLQRSPGSDLVYLKATQTFEVTRGSAKALRHTTDPGLWQGFADRDNSSFSSDPSAAGSHSGGNGMRVGYGLLGLGGVGLAGFAVTGLVRKRKRSEASD